MRGLVEMSPGSTTCSGNTAGTGALGRKSADKLLAALERSKHTTLPGLFSRRASARWGGDSALRWPGISAVGEALAGPGGAQLLAVVTSARSWPITCGGFDSPSSLAVVAQLREVGVSWRISSSQAPQTCPPAGQIWVVTGKLEQLGRDDATAPASARRQGGWQRFGQTTCVVAGPGAGSKLGKAVELRD